ncbi:uncharacterized protein LOC110983943 [Acanthaster planci]|uniref:Uncharacterized protein LOC110983943 n=1 Tax=Acanthaster planci TaxID=133434 RepID=A0A8B7Z156_ACAPL|nr:uncharacterized protein LOC110983943 [Acanthaster planci]
MDIIYRPGKSNANADSLSRIPRSDVVRILDETEGSRGQNGRQETRDAKTSAAKTDAGSQGEDGMASIEGQEQQPRANLEDKAVRHVHQLTTGTRSSTPPPSSIGQTSDSSDTTDHPSPMKSSSDAALDRDSNEVGAKSSSEGAKVGTYVDLPGGLRLLEAQQEDPTTRRVVELKQGVLVYEKDQEDRGETPTLIVLPKEMKRPVLQHVHDLMGHLGFEKVYQHVQDRYFWPSMYSDVKSYIDKCKRCALRKTSDTKRHASLQSINTTRPLELVCIDFLSLERSRGGFEHVLVVTDHYTRYAHSYPTRDEKATTVAHVLWERYMYIANYGIPERLHSDQGKSFESAVIKELCHLLGMRKSCVG